MQPARTVIVTGPTGIGKTDIVLRVATTISSAIINADVGQFYTPLSIGTAKPAWQIAPTPHYLFDVLSEPAHMSVVGYRNLLTPLINQIAARGQLPLIVGGSGFYINALFFPQTLAHVTQHSYQQSTQELWHELQRIDSERAAAIQPSDRYRIQRALDIWHSLGVKPSACRPNYDPVAPTLIFMLTAQTDVIYQRINERTYHMLAAGWIDEVRALSAAWHEFLLTKKIIGYDDIILYLRAQNASYENLVARIQQKTRNYAKRQLTFNRMLIKKLARYEKDVRVVLLDVTQKNPDDCALFVQQLIKEWS